MKNIIKIDGNDVIISNSEKLLFPELNIRKIDYLEKLIELSPYLLKHTSNRLLTSIRYPDNINQEFFYYKKVTENTPNWIDTIPYKKNQYINLNKQSTLIWLGNLATIEFHTAFNLYNQNYLSYLVFDLDPSQDQDFNHVIEVALLINKELNGLGVKSYVKTSGASGLQIFIPIKNKYSFEDGRKLNKFFGTYFSQKYPKLITIERLIKNRKGLLYFDYLQMWKGKSIISVYSPRAVKSGAISTPITWDELKKGIKPCDYNLLNIIERLKNKGDLFDVFLTDSKTQSLEHILEFIHKKDFD